MSRLADMDWVRDHLHDPDVVIVDCRFVLGKPEAGRKAYSLEHIPGAHYLDLEQDLSGTVREKGGRHPLPDPAVLAKKLEAIGIDETVRVITYDDQGGAMAARAWWLLTWLGHPDVQVMNGTFRLWKEKGFPVTTEIPTAVPRRFNPQIQPHMLADQSEVKQKLASPGTILLDSREEKRYLGIEEPIDRVAGHIPGAFHSFWQNVLNKEGKWKTSEELKDLFTHLDPDKEIIVYCGSGVTATPNVLALKEAGFERVKLYAGSWSDWISDPANPVARGRENGESTTQG
jgi:thiosulfate/3-mercaptopyruvate sulfurtransferase